MRRKYRKGEKRPLRTVLPSHCKIPARLRHELLQIHLHMGLEESMRACEAAGVNPHYAQIICRQEHGYSAPRRKKTAPGNPRPKLPFSTICFADPRWERAMAVGPVVV